MEIHGQLAWGEGMKIQQAAGDLTAEDRRIMAAYD
jgi:hypothetical protein